VDVIEDFNMPHVEYLNQEAPSQLCLADLEQQRDASKEKIALITTWDSNSVNEFITTPGECSKSISVFFSKFKKKDYKIIKRIYQCELSLDNLNPLLVSHMMEIHSQ
jgi:hypothetical protein